MVKINYSQTGFILEADTLDDNTVDGVIKILDKVMSATGAQPNPYNTERIVDNIHTDTVPVEHNVSIRKRLPNKIDDAGNETVGGNLIDMNNITKPTAKQTAHHNFRCPSCYQSAVTVISDSVILRDIYKGGVYLANGVDLKNFDYAEAATKAIEQVTLVADGSTECHCPKCGNDDLVEKWVDAFHNPLNYNENEVPCPICGSETVLNVNSGDKRVQKCENKDCGFELELEG